LYDIREKEEKKKKENANPNKRGGMRMALYLIQPR
jgi:hypothetical protein